MDNAQYKMKRRFIPPLLALTAGILAVSTASTFIRLAQQEVHPLAIAAWRLIIGGAVFLIAALIRQKNFFKHITRKEFLLIMLSGMLLAIHFGTWITSLSLTSVTASVVLVTCYPLFVAFGSSLFFRESFTPVMYAGIFMAFIGSVIIGIGDMGSESHHITGDVLALAGAISIAGYFIIGKKLRSHVPLIEYVALTYGSAAVFLFTAVLISGVRLTGFSSFSWLWIGMIALIPQITGHTLLNFSLKYMSATAVTLPILAEPVISVLLAWIVLSEQPPLQAVFGGFIILIGLYLAQSKLMKKNKGIME